MSIQPKLSLDEFEAMVNIERFVYKSGKIKYIASFQTFSEEIVFENIEGADDLSHYDEFATYTLTRKLINLINNTNQKTPI